MTTVTRRRAVGRRAVRAARSFPFTSTSGWNWAAARPTVEEEPCRHCSSPSGSTSPSSARSPSPSPGPGEVVVRIGGGRRVPLGPPPDARLRAPGPAVRAAVHARPRERGLGRGGRRRRHAASSVGDAGRGLRAVGLRAVPPLPAGHGELLRAPGRDRRRRRRPRPRRRHGAAACSCRTARLARPARRPRPGRRRAPHRRRRSRRTTRSSAPCRLLGARHRRRS